LFLDAARLCTSPATIQIGAGIYLNISRSTPASFVA